MQTVSPEMIQASIALAQIIALGAFVFWSTKRNAKDIEEIKENIKDDIMPVVRKIEMDLHAATITLKNALEIKEDVEAHREKIIVMGEGLKNQKKDINALHEKHREHLSTYHSKI